MDKFEELKNSTSWEEFFSGLDKISFNNKKYNEEIDLIELEADKFKNIEGYLYHLILLTIKIKQKLLQQTEEDLKRKAYFYKREQIDKLYELVLNKEIDENSLISSLFMIDIETIKDNEISKPLLEMIKKYKIDKFFVPEFYPLHYGIVVSYEYDFLIYFGSVIMSLLKNNYMDIEELAIIFIKYILSFTQNLSINNKPIYILEGVKLIIDIKKELDTKSDRFNLLYLDIINIVEQYLVAEYLYQRNEYKEEEYVINGDYNKIINDIDDLITQITYTESSLAMNIEDLFVDINKEFISNNKDLLYSIIKFFMEISCLEGIIPLDVMLKIYKGKLPKYKSSLVEEIILNNSFIEDLFKRKEWALVIKKYEQIYNKKLPGDKGYFKVAYSYCELNNVEKAEELYLYCIEVGQGTSSVYNNLGCIYDNQGNKEKALNYFKIAHELDKSEQLYIDNIIKMEKKSSPY